MIDVYFSPEISHQTEKEAAYRAVRTFFYRLGKGQITLHPECKQFLNSFVQLDNSQQEKPCPASKKPRTVNQSTVNKENSTNTLIISNPNQFVFDSDKNSVKTEIKEEDPKHKKI